MSYWGAFKPGNCTGPTGLSIAIPAGEAPRCCRLRSKHLAVLLLIDLVYPKETPHSAASCHPLCPEPLPFSDPACCRDSFRSRWEFAAATISKRQTRLSTTRIARSVKKDPRRPSPLSGGCRLRSSLDGTLSRRHSTQDICSVKTQLVCFKRLATCEKESINAESEQFASSRCRWCVMLCSVGIP